MMQKCDGSFYEGDFKNGEIEGYVRDIWFSDNIGLIQMGWWKRIWRRMAR